MLCSSLGIEFLLSTSLWLIKLFILYLIPFLQPVPVQASDLDIGVNSAITYKLVGSAAQPFSIDKSTGVIRTSSAVTIDFETKQSYQFKVSATDKLGAGMTSLSNVTITVSDLNDNGPVFSHLIYTAQIHENVGVGFPVMTLNATDKDSGYFGSVAYQIVSGTDGRFSIDAASGSIRTEAPIDREAKGSYALNVSAYDGGLPANVVYCTVVINIIDVNDNFPVFKKAQDVIVVEETAPVGTFVTRIQASDADSADFGNIGLSLRSEHFRIDRVTGNVTTIASLDREVIDRYALKVAASDTAGHQSNLSLLISVGDANDNHPEFLTTSPMTIDLFEKTPNGSIVAFAEAADKDIGLNGKIEYTLSESSGDLLRINNKTGLIRCVSHILSVTVSLQLIICSTV